MKTISILIAAALTFISSTAASGTNPLSRSLTGGTNHIHSITPIVATTDISGITPVDAIETVTYFDGIGRPIQEVNRGAGPFYTDIVTMRVYDPFGRETERKLPVTSAGYGAFVNPDSYDSAAPALYSGDTHPFTTTVYESSPLSRTLSISGPGQAWRQNNAATSYEYNVTYGSGERSCIRFSVNGTRDNHSLTSAGNYAVGTLTVVKTTDEDGRKALIFKDASDRTVLERRILGNGYADTHFVYDVYGNLCYVLSPEGSAAWEAGNHNQAVDDFGYQYKYDDKNRCIASKLPGADWTYHIYDRHDRLTFTQDGNLRMTGKWRMTLYDALGRQTFTGIYNGDASSLGIEDIDAATESAGTGGFFGYTLPAQIATSLVTPHVISYYDRYDTYLGNIAATAPSYLGFITRSGYDTSCDGRANGLMTGKLVFREDGSGSIPQIFFYDAKGRLIQTRNSMGHTLMNAYDFIGNNTRTYEAVTSGSETYWIETVRTFKHNGLIEDVIVTTNGNAQAQFTYTYDNLNRLTQVEYGDIVETYNYNLRGWSTGKTVTADGERLFSMSARYESPVNSQSLPQFGGNISEWQWGRGNLADKIYSFAYDALSRIISGTLIGNAAGNDTFAEKDITYDRNGNILTLKRFGENGIIADIVNIITGNRIASNTYDDCGNVTYDSASGTTLEWNSIGLIKKVSAIDGTLVNYSYLADGTKISALDDQGNGLEYRGSLTFRRNGSNLQIEGIDFPEGRFVAQENGTGGITLVPHFHITDHLGSVRAVVDGSTGQVVETNDYYPFGKRWDSSSSVTSPDNRFRFNGKEDQSEFGTPYSDYGARQYSSFNGRWLTVDPLAEKYYSSSPYAFCGNNPVNFVDLDGRRWVNSQRQVVYNSNGPTSYATPEQLDLIKAMRSSKTGYQQLSKLVDAPFDVEIVINSDDKPGKYGEVANRNIQYDESNKQYIAKGGSKITIYKQNAIARSEKHHISVNEAIAVNLGHEIEHITPEGLFLSHKYKGNKSPEALNAKEDKPKQISKAMLWEFENKLSFDKIRELQNTINSMIQNK